MPVAWNAYFWHEMHIIIYFNIKWAFISLEISHRRYEVQTSLSELHIHATPPPIIMTSILELICIEKSNIIRTYFFIAQQLS